MCRPEELKSDDVVEDASGDVAEESIKSRFARAIPHNDAVHLNTFLQRESRRVARNPCTYLCTSMFLTLALSAIGLIVGEFSIQVENEGWWSRGTVQSGRQRQANLVNNQRFNLAYNDSAWDIWMDPDISHDSYETLLYSAPFIPDTMKDATEPAEDNGDEILFRALGAKDTFVKQKLEEDAERRRLDEQAPSVLDGCDLGFYSQLSGGNLWPMWKIPDKEYKKTETRTILDADVLETICIAESNTQAYLEENGLCEIEARGCQSGKCIPPYSVVLYARLIVEGALDATSDGDFAMDCTSLAKAWTPELQKYTESTWVKDIADLKILLTPGNGSEEKDPEYPFGYYPALVQSDFDTNGGRSQYSSSIFDTASVVNGTVLYENVDGFDQAKDSKIVDGAYDTGADELAEIHSDSLVASDMTLALGSAVVITIAVMLHTQSPLITGLGLLQIALSFPMAYFVYNLILGFEYFPFLNFIGVFVVFALGAGDIYVAFDKWTNYRKNNMTKSTEFVAAYALPESLSAMFLTTITTALAFFATAICPVAPIKMFAIFCGLLILLDYFLVILFIFPGLCIYDLALIKRAAENKKGGMAGCWLGCVSCGTCFSVCHRTTMYDDVVVPANASEFAKQRTNDLSSAELSAEEEEKDSSDDAANYNSVQRLILTASGYLHQARWWLLVFCVVSFSLCCYYATQLDLPESSDVRLLKPGIQYEQNYMWRKEILSSDLNDLSGSRNSLIWGLDATDTGSLNDPFDGTALVLDETFDPSSSEAQIYLRDFCNNLYEEDFAMEIRDGYVCPINRFDKWLQSMDALNVPDPIYTDICGSPEGGIPIASDKFHACLSAWALDVQNVDILSRDGVVKYMRVPFRNSAVFTDPYGVLQEQWEVLDEWTTASNDEAPEGVNKVFFTSLTFHWHDTNGSIQKSAYQGAGISLAASACVVLLSSRSVVLTVFTTGTIFYILVTVTALLTAFGWTLGFLESICFSILIGVSVDFVIHFTHAYVHHKGELSREARTKYALITMGPSVLATAGTTFFSAVVMLFCTITFFRKFALVLFFTVVMATVASFVVFITLTNCFGPSNPTYLVDKCFGIDHSKPKANETGGENEDGQANETGDENEDGQANETGSENEDGHLSESKVKSLDE